MLRQHENVQANNTHTHSAVGTRGWPLLINMHVANAEVHHRPPQPNLQGDSGAISWCCCCCCRKGVACTHRSPASAQLLILPATAGQVRLSRSPTSMLTPYKRQVLQLSIASNSHPGWAGAPAEHAPWCPPQHSAYVCSLAVQK